MFVVTVAWCVSVTIKTTEAITVIPIHNIMLLHPTTLSSQIPQHYAATSHNAMQSHLSTLCSRTPQHNIITLLQSHPSPFKHRCICQCNQKLYLPNSTVVLFKWGSGDCSSHYQKYHLKAILKTFYTTKPPLLNSISPSCIKCCI